jgi:hypothetical protein
VATLGCVPSFGWLLLSPCACGKTVSGLSLRIPMMVMGDSDRIVMGVSDA